MKRTVLYPPVLLAVVGFLAATLVVVGTVLYRADVLIIVPSVYLLPLVVVDPLVYILKLISLVPLPTDGALPVPRVE